MPWPDAKNGLAFANGAILLLGVILYALLGGADFGGGVWDLLARGPRAAGERQNSHAPAFAEATARQAVTPYRSV